jgi:4-methoxybenzoate monooxygenase (O-demethylating)
VSARHRRNVINAPASDLDPFSETFLLDPYPAQRELREAAPVVRLERYGVWAMARYEHVRAALGDWATYRSGAGVGLADFTKEKPWRTPSLLLEADPPEHDGARRPMTAALSPSRIRALRAAFELEAEALADRLVHSERFDAVADLAQAFPVKVFADAVGVPDQGRENLIAYGEMVFNAFGPRNELLRQSAQRLDGASAWIADMCELENLAPGGLGAAIYEQASRFGLGADAAALLVRSLLSAGIDTTAYALGNAILCFAAHPDQWAALHADPLRSRAAFEEVLRFEAPVRTLFRTTTREVDMEGVRIPSGDKVLLFLAAAGRDPRHWDDPERFDISRKAGGQLGFGFGIHACAGRMVARLEAEVLLAALARRVKAIDLDGEPERKLNNALHGLARLPVRVHAAGTRPATPEPTTRPGAR